MKNVIWLSGMFLLCGNAQAADFVDTAKVISSTPIYVLVTEQKCWVESVPVEPGHSLGGALVGGAAGALIGSQVGDGTGKKIATVAGGVAGAVAGDRAATADRPQTRQVERCREVETEREVIKGYRVVYRYKDQDITTTLPYEPGPTLRIRINVIEDQR